MKFVKDIEQNTEEWLEARKGKITGSKLKDIIALRGTNKKIGFYELVAERLGIEDDSEDVMERGHRLESVAIEEFSKRYGKTVETGMLCISDENEYIALSPDGLIKNGKKYTEAVEVKCLGSAKHLQAFFENKIPDDYKFQVTQYFIVNQDLQTLYFCFYDPRISLKPFFAIEVNRKDIQEDIEWVTKYQVDTLNEVDLLLEQLVF